MLKVQFLLIFILHFSNGFEFIFKPGPLIPATKGEVWPKVQFEDKKEEFFTLLPAFFRFKITGNTCNILNEALDRYKNLITFNSRLVKTVYFNARNCYETDPKFLGFLTVLDVELTEPCDDAEFPTFEMKEEYVLNVTENTKKLQSATVWGILRGLETFSQLPYLTEDFACHRVNATSIHDYPRFAHRGFLLDTSRHYMPKNQILKLLDAISYNKLNVFHWHIVDDYSFPYVSVKFPELTLKGAYHPTLMVYNQEFVQEVQEYARKRGIRVVAEFDTPGHTLSWGASHPELLTKCHNVERLDLGPMDPTKNSTYDLVFELFKEIKEVFKDQFVHLGGDEVDYECWKSNEEVNQFMQAHGIAAGDYSALQSYYMQKLIDHVTSLNLKSIVWEEVFVNGVNIPKTAVINVWKNFTPKEVLANVTSAGYSTIISSYWYLDILSTGGDWLKFYNQDAHDFEGSEEQKKLVLGGETCMWSEVVDENNIESRVWPRASVAAEKFWSKNEGKKSGWGEIWPIASRLEEQTCRMKRRGIGAQPPTGPSVCF